MGTARFKMVIKVLVEEIPEALDLDIGKITDVWCSGGYATVEDNSIHIDKRIPIEKKRLVAIHEVLEMRLNKRTKHSKIDQIAIDIIDALDQLDMLKEGSKDENLVQ